MKRIARKAAAPLSFAPVPSLLPLKNSARALSTVTYDDVLYQKNLDDDAKTKTSRQDAKSFSYDLSRLDAALKNQRSANSSDLISHFEAINEKGQFIPLTYLYDAVALLAQRHDILRMELLLRLSKQNMKKYRIAFGPAGELPSVIATRSQPQHNPFDKLASFAIGEMMIRGHADDALKLWMRLSASGHVTSKISLEKLLEKISTAGANQVPNIDFIDKVHDMLTSKLWQQSPEHYRRMLSVYRQHILWSCTSVEGLSAAAERVDGLWKEYQKLEKFSTDVSPASKSATELDLEVLSLRVQVCVALMKATSRLASDGRAAGAGAVTGAGAVFDAKNKVNHDNAVAACEQLINRLSEVSNAAVEEVQAVHGNGASAVAGSGASAASGSVVGVVDVIKQLISSLQPFATVPGDHENNLRSNDQTSEEDTSGRRRTGAGAGVGAYVQRHYDYTRTAGLVRTSVAELLEELSRSGRSAEAVSLLDHYLSTTTTTMASAAASASSTTAADTAPILGNQSVLNSTSSSIGIGSSGSSGSGGSIGGSAKVSTLAALAAKAGSRQKLQEISRQSSLPYLLTTQEFIDELFARIIRNTDASASTSSFSSSSTSTTTVAAAASAARSTSAATTKESKDLHRQHQRQHIDAVNTLADSLQKLAEKHNISLSVGFLGAWVEAYAPHVGLAPSASSNKGWDWKTSLAAAQRVLDSFDDTDGRSPTAYHSLVSLLCSHDDAEAVVRAFDLVAHETVTEHVTPQLKTWTTILHASINHQGDDDLRGVLEVVEDRTKGGKGKGSNKTDASALLEARLRAYCRLRDGYKALQLAHSLRASGVSLSRQAYIWVINAIHMTTPAAEAEWRIIKDPTAACEWLLREMHRDGHDALPSTAAKLLKLHGKACQIARTQGNLEATIRHAEEFVAQMCTFTGTGTATGTATGATGTTAAAVRTDADAHTTDHTYMGHPKVPFNESILRELVKVYCVSGREEGALLLVQEAEKRYGIKPTVTSYEPIVFYYALLGRLTLAEDALTMMVSRGLQPSDNIADAFLACHLRQSETRSTNIGEALDRTQDLYNSFGVRPSVTGILRLLDLLLENDVHEARRAVTLIEQLYSAEERRTAVHYPNHWRGGRTDRRTRSEKTSSSSPTGTASSIHSSYTADLDEFDGVLPGHRLGRGVVPVEHGALTEEALSARFGRKGLSLRSSKKR